MNRIYAMILRHYYMITRSGPRAFAMFYWPIIDIVLWGLISRFMMEHNAVTFNLGNVLISAVLLGNIVYHSQVATGWALLEDVWARNMVQVMITPIRPHEYALGLITVSVLKTFIGVLSAAIVAYILFNFNITDLGFPLLGFYFQLTIFGVTIGLLGCALILRFGMSADLLIWVIASMIAPISCVIYPVSVLPEVLQPLAKLLPSTLVFEGMREIMQQHTFNWDYFYRALISNGILFTLSMGMFIYSIHSARRHNRLMSVSD